MLDATGWAPQSSVYIFNVVNIRTYVMKNMLNVLCRMYGSSDSKKRRCCASNLMDLHRFPELSPRSWASTCSIRFLRIRSRVALVSAVVAMLLTWAGMKALSERIHRAQSVVRRVKPRSLKNSFS